MPQAPASPFAQHYAQLHDEDLIDLALTRELAPDAAAALKAELAARGLHDLSGHQRERESEARHEDAARQTDIARRQRVVRWRTGFIVVVAVLVLARGAWLMGAPNPAQPGDDGGLLLALGVALLGFAALSSWLSGLWMRQVLRRAPPR